MRICPVDDIPDTWLWSPSSTGNYTVSSAYSWMLELRSNESGDASWNWVWKLKLPANIQFFLWQLCHAAIPTKGILVVRGVMHADACPICDSAVETWYHCLFTCPTAVGLWGAYGMANLCPPQNDDMLRVWLRQVILSKGIIIPVILWTLWCARNRKLFENASTSLPCLVAQVAALNFSICTAYGMAETCTLSVPRVIAWQKQREGIFVLNVDGSAISNPGKAGFGGIVRDHAGGFITAFYGSDGFCNILHAEVLALLHGINIAWEAGYKEVICYSDSLNTVKLVSKGVPNCHPEANYIALIRKFLNREWDFQLFHTLREGNQSADYLAKLGAKTDELLVVLSVPPAAMEPILLADAIGVAFYRH